VDAFSRTIGRSRREFLKGVDDAEAPVSLSFGAMILSQASKSAGRVHWTRGTRDPALFDNGPADQVAFFEDGDKEQLDDPSVGYKTASEAMEVVANDITETVNQDEGVPAVVNDLQSGEEPRTELTNLDEATKYQRFLQAHNAVQGHRGYRATVLSLRERGLDWRGAVQDVQRLVLRSCPVCQKADTKDLHKRFVIQLALFFLHCFLIHGLAHYEHWNAMKGQFYCRSFAHQEVLWKFVCGMPNPVEGGRFINRRQ
jgi:hypothetical protein